MNNDVLPYSSVSSQDIEKPDALLSLLTGTITFHRRFTSNLLLILIFSLSFGWLFCMNYPQPAFALSVFALYRQYRPRTIS